MDKSTLQELGKYQTFNFVVLVLIWHLRYRHTVCINNNVIYLFGGADLE